jgi:hypothetical protein
MEARAVNSDYKSLTQTILANGLLDYYLREKDLEKYLKTAVEYAVVFGEGYVKMEWDSTAGEPFEFNEETQTYIHEGDIKFANLSPFDVIRDQSREDTDHDWVITRSYKNRYDLIAKYPELEDKILKVSNKDEHRTFMAGSLTKDETDLIPIYEFYHKRTDAIPNGRYMLYVSSDAILFDGALPYRFLPVFRIAPANILGTPYGYTPMFDLMPIQEAINTLYSVILTNQNAFGVQNVAVPKGADLVVSQLVGGLNLMEYNPAFGKPEGINLTQTPAEIFKMIDILERVMETLSGVNSVARGNPEASLKSGTALALVQAQAVQFANGLQQSYVKLIENIGTSIIKLLQDFASVPRVAAIAGKAKRTYMKEFTGDDLSSVNRVIVEIANPLAKTTAGRMEIANNLIQMGLIKNVDQYFIVLKTGELDTMMEGDVSELLLIRAENERMVEGQAVITTDIDRHSIHIKEHRSILADPDLRRDPTLVKLALDHIQQHIEALRNTDPALLGLIGEQPMPPPGGGQVPPQPNEQATEAEAAAGANNAALQEPLPTGAEQAPGLPNLPKPPAPFQDLPIAPGEETPQ